MASYQHLLPRTKPWFESPAKVFARLKSKVQREEMCANEDIVTGKDPLCNGREKHGAVFKSPRKRTMTDELKDNQRFGSYRNEAQALTLSPISSPQKTFGCSYSDISGKPGEDLPLVIDMRTKGAFLESTAVSQPLFLYNNKQIHTEPPQTRDLEVRTPGKIQPAETNCVRSVFEEECAPVMAPADMFSPMRKRLRKRQCEPWGFNNVSSGAKEVCSEVICRPQERKTFRTFSEDDTHINTCVEDLGPVRGLCTDQSDMNQFTHEPTVPPPRSTTRKRCGVFMDNVPPMSPAKMFAYMKERESKTVQQEVRDVSSSSGDLFDGGNSHLSRDTFPSTAYSAGETEDSASLLEKVVSVNSSRVESASRQADSDPPEDVLIPAAPSQPVLLEDPLVLNTPRISIPKKNEAVFKRNKWPQCAKFPNESVIYLKKWFLRRNHVGLFVDGIHREDNIPWNSNIILDRVSNYVLKTVSGRVYILVGKMNLSVDTDFPKWFLKKFLNGFPPNWKALYEKLLSETRDKPNRQAEGRAIVAKTKSEASSIDVSVRRQRQKPLKTPDSCPPASESSIKMSRSGRLIKPPLEYWKGGRVTVDAHMNVTVHEGYDTSIFYPDVTTTVSAKASQKPACVFLPCSEGRKRCQSASNDEASVPLRRVKAPVHKRNRAKVNPDKEPSYSPECPGETPSSPEEWSGRRTRSRPRCPTTERTLHVDTVPQKQSEPEKSSTRRSKKRTHDTTRPSVSVLRSKQASRASPESPTVNDKTSQDQSSNDDFSIRRTRRGRGARKKRGEKSQPSHLFPSSESEESGKELERRTRVTTNRDAAQIQTKRKQSKCTKTSQPSKPLPKSTQSSNKNKADKGNTRILQEQDEDEWTEAELVKLQEAVSFYPKHITGYWAKVARLVGTRSAEECHNQHTSQGTSRTPAKKAKMKKVEAPKDPVTDHPVISARQGTFKRKQQVREFLETMPREDVEDVFSSAYMQNKRFEMPSLCPSDDHDFALSDLEPLTPRSTAFPEVKTPQCLHITPGMMGSPNRNHDDKYVFQLQKRMKKSQFNVCKQAPSKRFTPTPSVKRTMRRCGNTENDTFVVWEMFPGNNGALSESGEEEDFYFSDND